MSTKTIKTDAQVREGAEQYRERLASPIRQLLLSATIREEVMRRLKSKGEKLDEVAGGVTAAVCIDTIRAILDDILGVGEECDCAPGECEKDNRVAEAEQRRKDDHVEAKEDAAAGVDPEEDAEDDNTDAAPEDALKLDASQELVDAAISLLLRALN